MSTISKSDLPKRVTSPPAKAAKLKKIDVSRLLSYRMNVVSNLLSRALASHFATVGEIGLLEWRALTLLSTYEPMKVKSLARHAAIDFGQTSRLVTRLTQRGLVAKVSGCDARSVNLSLTPAGRDLQERLWQIAMKYNAKYLQALSPEQRLVLFSALDTLAAAASKLTAGSRETPY